MGKRLLSALSVLLLLSVSSPGAAGAAERLFTLNPCRAIDTLAGVAAAANKPITGATNTWINLRGRCGVPTDATAVAAHITAIPAGNGIADHSGHLIIFDAGMAITDPVPGLPIPDVSTINWSNGSTTMTNFVIIPFESNKTQIKVWGGYGPAKKGVYLIVDVVGYFK